MVSLRLMSDCDVADTGSLMRSVILISQRSQMYCRVATYWRHDVLSGLPDTH